MNDKLQTEERELKEYEKAINSLECALKETKDAYDRVKKLKKHDHLNNIVENDQWESLRDSIITSSLVPIYERDLYKMLLDNMHNYLTQVETYPPGYTPPMFEPDFLNIAIMAFSRIELRNFVGVIPIKDNVSDIYLLNSTEAVEKKMRSKYIRTVTCPLETTENYKPTGRIPPDEVREIVAKTAYWFNNWLFAHINNSALITNEVTIDLESCPDSRLWDSIEYARKVSEETTLRSRPNRLITSENIIQIFEKLTRAGKMDFQRDTSAPDNCFYRAGTFPGIIVYSTPCVSAGYERPSIILTYHDDNAADNGVIWAPHSLLTHTCIVIDPFTFDPLMQLGTHSAIWSAGKTGHYVKIPMKITGTKLQLVQNLIGENIYK